MNYTPYFNEIEEAFIRRRGKHLFVSPMDWALIESWKEMGIPLHIALRGIETAFDSFESKPRRYSVKSLKYCQEEVEAQFGIWKESQVGASDSNSAEPGADANGTLGHSPFSRLVVLAFLSRAIGDLEKAQTVRGESNEFAFCNELTFVTASLLDLKQDFESDPQPNVERLEESLGKIEKLLDEALLAHRPASEIDVIRNEARSQLATYRSRMTTAIYEQTFNNLVLKRLREQNAVPRLGLFYL